MKIVEYDQADPIGILQLNMLSLGWPLTLELAARIRQLDPRPFPFFALYAHEDGMVAGQVAVYRLPTMTTDGPEDVGGLCAVCTHPAFSRRGVSTALMDEAHRRMRAAGLRFSTLGTARHRAAYALIQKHGYQGVFTPTMTFARRENAGRESSLRAECAGLQHLEFADHFYQRIASGRLGFARRHESFITMMAAIGDLNANDVWLLWDNEELVGYAMARVVQSVLVVDNLLLGDEANAAETVSALAANLNVAYIQVRADCLAVMDSLRRAGYPPGYAGWSTFMVKPLSPAATVEDATRLLGIGTERFLISCIDVT